MTGENFDLLPADLVAVYSLGNLDSTAANRYWPLKSVSEDGTKAYFELLESVTYQSASPFNIFATPKNPPRIRYTDFVDRT